MKKWMSTAVAAAAGIAIAAGGAIGAGHANAAPHSATFPAIQNGTTVNGWGWTGTLLTRAQTRQAYDSGILSLFGADGIATYQKAITPDQGAGCIVIFRATHGNDTETNVTYIRRADFATQTPDTINAAYWSTKNFRCV